MLHKSWTEGLGLFLRRPPYYQVAALCWRVSAASERTGGQKGMQILLVSSKGSGRWVLPKGWPKNGMGGGETAIEEAWEEAGIQRDAAQPVKIGRYRYKKRLAGDLPVPTVVDIYAMQVNHLADSYPEAGQRKRKWFSPEDAASLVAEPELAGVLRQVSNLIAQSGV